MKLNKILILPTLLGALVILIYLNVYMSIDKPSDNYYIDTLCKKLSKIDINSDDCHVTLLSTDYYSSTKIKSENLESICGSLKALKNKDISGESISKEISPKYKYILSFKKDKFVVDIYDKTLITVYEWDGKYKKDYISMNGCYPYENLYDISFFIHGYE